MARHRQTKYVPEAVSIQLAAAILGISPLTVRRWIRHGYRDKDGDKRYIKAYRVGPTLIRIPRDEIARLRRQALFPRIDNQP